MFLGSYLFEEAKKQKLEVQKAIANIKEEISSTFKEHNLPFENKLKQDLEILSKMKETKFKRDQNDHEESKVYSWNQRHHAVQPHRRRAVSFQLPCSDEEHTAAEGSSFDDFLETRSRTEARTKRRKGRRPEAERLGPQNQGNRMRLRS